MASSPLPAVGPALVLPWFFKLLRGPTKLLTLSSRPRSYLTMQHLVARLPGGAPS